MMRLLVFLLAITGVALGLAQLAERPGTVSLTWLGYQVETSIFVAIIGLAVLLGAAILLWSLIRYIITRPSELSRQLRERKEELGVDALSRGLIAVGAGDKAQAEKFATVARKRLPNEPLTGLLRAQAAQLRGDRDEARRIFQSMAEQPRTELLGLRGLFLEARRVDEMEAARQFAQRAMERNPDLVWSVNALFELQCRAGNWDGALRTVDVARRQKQIDRDAAERRRAILLTAQARELEDTDTDRARELALEANKLAPDLVPAAELAGRMLASQGKISRAGKILSRAWERSPHPDLAMAYAFLRLGDSPRDRLKRVMSLAHATPDNIEGRVAVAVAAIEARDWAEARDALQPLLDDRPSSRVCTLMARIEGGESGDQGRVREWLARAVRAPRDPVWTADGFVSSRWEPVSPISGALDAFEWRVPVESIGPVEPRTFIDEPLESVADVEAAPEDKDEAEEAQAGEPEDETVPVKETAPEDAMAAVEKAVNDEMAALDARTGDAGSDAPSADLGARPGEPAPERREFSTNEEQVFVAPRPPDDPGTEPIDAENLDEEAPYPAEKP
ncbi:MAG: heme biosynthesis protein HemY [Hyphomicrobiales bacterium]|nr:heme biosynthesis protein HemY [Hyphomicrobiales bacterium]